MTELKDRINEALNSVDMIDAQIAKHLEVTRGALSQWRSGGIKTLKADTAAKIEALTGYSSSWLSTGTGEKLKKGLAVSIHEVDVPLLSVSASMGAGIDILDDDVISAIRISTQWINNRIRPLSNKSNLRFIHAYGDSMEPTFNNGDILLVDVGHKTPDIDGIYVMEAQNMLFIKRVSRNISGELIITSDNPKIRTSDILKGDSEVTIHGRVVWAWNGKSL